MTTMELRARIFEKLNSLLDNEEAMLQLNDYLHELNQKLDLARKDIYTLNELNGRIDRAEIEISKGETLDSQNLFTEIEDKYSWLCK